ncbi:MAG: hypothetical protein ACI4UT_01860 [Candidatus Enteromonas sp.]
MAEEKTLSVVEDTNLDAEFGDLEAEMQKQFAEDAKALEENVEFSEDLGAYASGFPDWDLLPPEK